MEGEMREKKIQEIERKMLADMDLVCERHNLKYSLAFGTVLGAVRHRGFIPWDDDADIMVSIDGYRNFCKVLQDEMPEQYCIYSYWYMPDYEYLFARLGLKDAQHREIHVDIFPMVGAPKTGAGRMLFARVAYLVFRSYYLKKIEPDVTYRNETRKRWLARISKIVLRPFPPGLFVRIYEMMQKQYPVNQARYLYNFCGLYKDKETIPREYLRDLIRLEFEGCQLPVPRDWNGYLTQMYGDYMTPKRTNYV